MSKEDQVYIEGSNGVDVIDKDTKAVIVASAVEGVPAMLDVKVVKHHQDNIRHNLISLDANIHANAVQCLLHAEKHGDTSLMRRLLIDIVDAKSGYRRQGLIAWMRAYSPMELKGDTINLSGMIPGSDGVRRPFLIEEANRTPFSASDKFREVVLFKPIFKDGLTSKIERAMKEYKAAVDNTLIVPGEKPKPKDPKKPFYDGIHLDKMEAGFAAIEKIMNTDLNFGDETASVYAAQDALKKANMAVAAAQGKQA